jgi:hypothetical protein
MGRGEGATIADKVAASDRGSATLSSNSCTHSLMESRHQSSSANGSIGTTGYVWDRGTGKPIRRGDPALEGRPAGVRVNIIAVKKAGIFLSTLLAGIQ